MCLRWGKGIIICPERSGGSEGITAGQTKVKTNENRRLGTKRVKFQRQPKINMVWKCEATNPDLPPFLYSFLTLSLPSSLPLSCAGRRSELCHSDPTPHCCHGEARRSSLTAAGFLRVISRTQPGRQRQAPFSVYARESELLCPSLSISRSPSPSLLPPLLLHNS